MPTDFKNPKFPFMGLGVFQQWKTVTVRISRTSRISRVRISRARTSRISRTRLRTSVKTRTRSNPHPPSGGYIKSRPKSNSRTALLYNIVFILFEQLDIRRDRHEQSVGAVVLAFECTLLAKNCGIRTHAVGQKKCDLLSRGRQSLLYLI